MPGYCPDQYRMTVPVQNYGIKDMGCLYSDFFYLCLCLSAEILDFHR